MSVKLLLNPAAASKACIHPETGITFHIKPLSPERYEEVRLASVKKYKDDFNKFRGELAVEIIEDWGDEVGDKNGPLPCDEANKRQFGRVQSINIMPWMVDQATSLSHFIIEEEVSAKNA